MSGTDLSYTIEDGVVKHGYEICTGKAPGLPSCHDSLIIFFENDSLIIVISLSYVFNSIGCYS